MGSYKLFPRCSISERSSRDPRPEDRVKQICSDYNDFTRRTNAIAAEVANEKPELSPSQFGTEVHLKMKENIEALNRPDLRAEFSVVGSGRGNYGDIGSTRFDIYQFDDADQRVCVYDIYTGASQKRASDFVRQYWAAREYRQNYDIIILQIGAPRP
jgi:hypothetical protein